MSLSDDVDPACAGLVASLEGDPFYRSIVVDFAPDSARQRAVLSAYFAYAIREGRALGRSVHLADRALGVAVWLLPQPPDTLSRARLEKQTFLQGTLGPAGCGNYRRMVDFMSRQAAGIVGDDAWYLSIIGVDPAMQGRGVGRALLVPTLHEADLSRATCYLETFSPGSGLFYERLGFETSARFVEPITNAEYAVMVRGPRLTPDAH